MHNVQHQSDPGTLWVNFEFSGQFTANEPGAENTQYILSVPGHVTAVF